jgi:uncharacterized protein
VGREKLLYRD